MKKQKTRIFLIILIYFFITSLAAAQVPQEEDNIEASDSQIEENILLYSGISLENMQVVSREGTGIKIGFDVKAGKVSQAGVIFVIELLKRNDSNGKLLGHHFDRQVFDGKNFIPSGETIHKELIYYPPAFFSGKYQLFLSARNEKSKLYDMGSVGEVSLSGTGEYIRILPETCRMTIQGDDPEKKYYVDQGVDVSQEENLIGSCEVVNDFKKTISVTPVFETFYRTSFGEKIAESKQPAVSLNPGEKKVLNFTLPKAQKPQAYDATLAFLNETGETVSNKINFHYVLQGLSATIQNLKADKDSYLSGETARVAISFTGSADSFIRSRNGGTDSEKEMLELEIINNKGQNCADKISEEIDSRKERNRILTADITRDCDQLTMKAAISDGKGNVLDEGSYFFGNDARATERRIEIKDEKKQEEKTGLKILINAVIILGLVLVIIYYFYHKNRSAGAKMLFFFAIASGVLLFSGIKAEAACVDCGGHYDYIYGWGRDARPGESYVMRCYIDRDISIAAKKAVIAYNDSGSPAGSQTSGGGCTRTTLGTNITADTNTIWFSCKVNANEERDWDNITNTCVRKELVVSPYCCEVKKTSTSSTMVLETCDDITTDEKITVNSVTLDNTVADFPIKEIHNLGWGDITGKAKLLDVDNNLFFLPNEPIVAEVGMDATGDMCMNAFSYSDFYSDIGLRDSSGTRVQIPDENGNPANLVKIFDLRPGSHYDSFWDSESQLSEGHQVTFPAPATPGKYTAIIYARVFYPSLYTEPGDDEIGGEDMFGCYNTTYKNSATYLHNFHLIDTKKNWYMDFAGIARIPFTVSEKTTANLRIEIPEGKGYVYEISKNGIITNPNLKLCYNITDPCTIMYNFGDKIKLKAIPYAPAHEPYAFYGWGGVCSGSDPEGCEILMNANKTVTASFRIPSEEPEPDNCVPNPAVDCPKDEAKKTCRGDYYQDTKCKNFICPGTKNDCLNWQEVSAE